MSRQHCALLRVSCNDDCTVVVLFFHTSRYFAGPAGISQQSVEHLRKDFPNESHALNMLRFCNGIITARGRRSASAVKDEHGVCSPTKRRRIQMCRVTVAKRVGIIGAKVLSQKKTFLQSCPNVTLIIDEGNCWSKACPLYVATMSCNAYFEWRCMFIGQAETSGKKDGKSIHVLVKGVFVKTDMIEDIYPKLNSVSTDGASVMRSTSDHSGLDCNGTTGRAFSSFVKRELREDTDFWHCAIHQFNLSVNDALDAITALKLFFVPHMRMMHSEFSRSSCRRHDLGEIFKTWDQDHPGGWRLFYPILFCLTRWVGLQKCAAILSRNPDSFRGYGQHLRDNGFGPREFNPYKYRKRRDRREREEAGADDNSGALSSDDEEGEDDERFTEAMENDRLDDDGFQPGPELFPSMEDAAASAPLQEDLVRAEGFDVGNTDATKYKKKNLLNPNVGITEVNIARAAYMSGILLPYKILIEQLQSVQNPQVLDIKILLTYFFYYSFIPL